MSILTPEQLTGRVRSHVVEIAELGCSLHPQAAQAFLLMRRAAASAGIDIAPVSAFRDFEQQLAIWNGKFRGERALLDRDGAPLNALELSPEERVRAILHWSALPGASRHHWGTEIDVYDRAAQPGAAQGGAPRPQLLPGEYAGGGIFAALSAWLAEHGAHYGFFLPYDSDRGGVQPEPWHLSFAPLSSALLQGLTPELVGEALRGVTLAGAAAVLRLLPEIHARYVRAVATPDTRALEAPGLSQAVG